MIRSFVAMVMVGVFGLVLAPALLQGCSQTGVGDPCTPAREYDPTFLGFDPGEVNVESKSFQCQTRLCLANHFQGRVTCPYGQTKSLGFPGAGLTAPAQDVNQDYIGACGIPGSKSDSSGNVVPSADAVVGDPSNATTLTGNEVKPQCLDRTADKAVYCSCRCANAQGKTDDGAVYCQCPDGFTCQQNLVTPIGPQDTGLTGAYCVKKNTTYDPVNSCQESGPHCDATKKNCGTFNGQ